MHCIPLFLDPSDGVFGRFDLAALCGCHTLNICYVMLSKVVWSEPRVSSEEDMKVGHPVLTELQNTRQSCAPALGSRPSEQSQASFGKLDLALFEPKHDTKMLYQHCIQLPTGRALQNMPEHKSMPITVHLRCRLLRHLTPSCTTL